MNKVAKGRNIISVVLTLLVIGIYLIPNFASAISVAISDILDTNKGNDVSFNITIDIEDPDRFVPINFTNLTIEHTGTEHVDKLVCTIEANGEFACERTKGNHTTGFTDIDITATKDQSLGFGYGYGYANGYGYAPDSGYGYAHNFGYGYGYGYGNGQGNFGKITYSVLWHTPVNLHPGEYSAIAKLYAKDKIFFSDTKVFNITTPANPVKSHNQTANIPANQGATVDASVADTILSILTDSNVSGLITIDKYTSNPTTNTSIFGVKGLNKFIGIEADSSIDDALTSVTINVSYTDAEVSAAGLDENTLRLYFFNSSSNGWVVFDPPNGDVDTVNNYVWANTTHFSIWGIFGNEAPAPPALTPAPSPAVGAPGGGGGGSDYRWQCTEWSECSPEGIQTRTCTNIGLSPGIFGKPAETRNCVYVAEEVAEEEEVEVEEEEEEAPAEEEEPTVTPPTRRGGLIGITGRAIQSILEGEANIGVGIFIILVIVTAGLVFYAKVWKKRK
jgi:hypothetical protein